MEAKARELEITWLDKSAPMLLHKLRSFMQVGAHSRTLGHSTLALTHPYAHTYPYPRTHARTHSQRRTRGPPQTELGFGEFGFRTAHDAPIIQARRCARC